MKRTVFTLMFVFALSLASFATKYVATGKTWSALGDYRIEVAATPVVIDGVELQTFIITYDNSDSKITVAVDKQKKCNKFIVMSDKLSVQYICTGSYFGVEKLEKGYECLGCNTSDDEMDRAAYLSQRVISREVATPIDNTKLIACYFPALVKDFNSMIAKK